MASADHLPGQPLLSGHLDETAVDAGRRAGFALDWSRRLPSRAEAVAFAGQNAPLAPWLQIVLRRYACREAQISDDLVLETRVLLPPLPGAVNALVGELGPWLAEDDPARVIAADLLIRELLTNAIAHRGYDEEAATRPVELQWFTDGLAVHSPGEPVPAAELQSGHFEGAASRNPKLMALLSVVTGARLQRGVGWRAAVRAARSLGYQLEAHAAAESTIVRLSIDPERYLERQQTGADTRQRVPVDAWMAEVLAELRKGPQRARELRERLGLPPSTMRAVLHRLERDGLAVTEHPNRRSPKQRWLLNRDPDEP